jgi:hypothetical protein
MSEFDPITLRAFNEELEKLGAGLNLLPGLARRALSGGSVAALGGAGGAALGGAVGAARGGAKARREGRSVLGGALGGGLGGAALGAGLGAGAGLIGGVAAGRRGADWAKALAKRDDVVGQVSRFGQRQAHSVTGALPEGFRSRTNAIRSLRGGGYSQEKQLRELGKKWQTAKGPERIKLQKQREGMKKALEGATAAEETGMTSVPGLFRAMADPEKFKRGITGAVKQQWHGTGTGIGGAVGKGMMVGFPGMMVAGEAVRPSDPGEASRVSRVLGSAAEFAPYAVLPMGMAGATLVGSGAGTIGRGIGSLLPGGRRRPRDSGPEPEEAEGLASPVERIESPQVQGRAPEGLGG